MFITSLKSRLFSGSLRKQINFRPVGLQRKQAVFFRPSPKLQVFGNIFSVFPDKHILFVENNQIPVLLNRIIRIMALAVNQKQRTSGFGQFTVRSVRTPTTHNISRKFSLRIRNTSKAAFDFIPGHLNLPQLKAVGDAPAFNSAKSLRF